MESFQLVFEWPSNLVTNQNSLGKYVGASLGLKTLLDPHFKLIASDENVKTFTSVSELRDLLRDKHTFLPQEVEGIDDAYTYIEYYTHGKNCLDDGKLRYRSTTVEYRCCLPKSREPVSFISIEEPMTCVYHAVMCTMYMCNVTSEGLTPPRRQLLRSNTKSLSSVVEASRILDTLRDGCFSLHDSCKYPFS